MRKLEPYYPKDYCSYDKGSKGFREELAEVPLQGYLFHFPEGEASEGACYEEAAAHSCAVANPWPEDAVGCILLLLSVGRKSCYVGEHNGQVVEYGSEYA